MESWAAGGFSGKFCELLKLGSQGNRNHTAAVITEPVSLSLCNNLPRESRALQGSCNMTRDSRWEGQGRLGGLLRVGGVGHEFQEFRS